MGAGRSELARMIFGADKIEKGEIIFEGKKVKINSTKDAVETWYRLFIGRQKARRGIS